MANSICLLLPTSYSLIVKRFISCSLYQHSGLLSFPRPFPFHSGSLASQAQVTTLINIRFLLRNINPFWKDGSLIQYPAPIRGLISQKAPLNLMPWLVCARGRIQKVPSHFICTSRIECAFWAASRCYSTIINEGRIFRRRLEG